MKRRKFNNVPKDHLLLIRKIAHTSHSIYGWDEEDLFSEGCLAYCLIRTKYDPLKGFRKTTFFWKSIARHLQHYIAKNQKVICPITDMVPDMEDDNHELLTENVQLALNAPMELIDKFFPGICIERKQILVSKIFHII